MLLTLAMIFAGSVFIVGLALLCAEEGHEIEGVGFHRGPLEGCPLCRAYDALAHCAECNVVLLPHEGCLHIPAMPFERPSHSFEGGDQGLAAFARDVPFHPSGDTCA